MQFFAFLVVFFCFSAIAYCEEEDAKAIYEAWNSKIDWSSDIDDGLERAKKENKPVLMLVHRKWCHACKALAPRFKESKSAEKLSKYFIMLNVFDDAEPWQEEYQPDGKYVPRVHFLNKEGELLKDVVNTAPLAANYKYFYDDYPRIIESMKKTLTDLKIEFDDPDQKKEL